MAPSSSQLSQVITDTGLHSKNCVVEAGTGTGVFTKEILRKISDTCLFFGIEINEVLLKETKKNCPNAIVHHGSVADIQHFLKSHNRQTCDSVISGLPWASFSESLQVSLLNAIYDSLSEEGELHTFSYLTSLWVPSGRHFRRLIHETFTHVEESKTVWRNFPPAFVYHCVK